MAVWNFGARGGKRGPWFARHVSRNEMADAVVAAIVLNPKLSLELAFGSEAEAMAIFSRVRERMIERLKETGITGGGANG